jgi:hypothetical protein
MATTVYDSGYVELVDGTQVYIKPLKIKYLREFMDVFDLVHLAKTEDQSINVLSHCAFVAFKPHCEDVKTKEDFEDVCDLPGIYKILDITAGIKIKEDSSDSVKKQAEDSKSNTWDTLDLAELEAEVFLLGIWKDYEDLEISLSMPELLATLAAKREADYEEKKFLAAIQGVDIEKNNKKEPDAWEKMKARVFSGGKTSDSNDIVSFQGTKAQQNGFGIGMGLGYEDLTKK